MIELASRATSRPVTGRSVSEQKASEANGKLPELCYSSMCPSCRRVAISVVALPLTYTCPGCKRPVVRR